MSVPMMSGVSLAVTKLGPGRYEIGGCTVRRVGTSGSAARWLADGPDGQRLGQRGSLSDACLLVRDYLEKG